MRAPFHTRLMDGLVPNGTDELGWEPWHRHETGGPADRRLEMLSSARTDARTRTSGAIPAAADNVAINAVLVAVAYGRYGEGAASATCGVRVSGVD